VDQVQYERWKQHLEAEWEAAAEQIRAGFRSQMRILDQVRTALPEGGGSGPVASSAPPPPRPMALPASAPGPSPSPPPAASPGPASAAERRRRPPGELLDRVCQALFELPEMFDRSELLAALDPKPKRASLYGVLQNLRSLGWIECMEAGRGTQPSRYRQLEPPPDPADES
jgi:hypothetical protein